MPPKLQLLAVVAFAVAMLFLENQIQKLEESRSKLGKRRAARGWSWEGGVAIWAVGRPSDLGSVSGAPETERACKKKKKKGGGSSDSRECTLLEPCA